MKSNESPCDEHPGWKTFKAKRYLHMHKNRKTQHFIDNIKQMHNKINNVSLNFAKYPQKVKVHFKL